MPATKKTALYRFSMRGVITNKALGLPDVPLKYVEGETIELTAEQADALLSIGCPIEKVRKRSAVAPDEPGGGGNADD